jgi:hypothetical protein
MAPIQKIPIPPWGDSLDGTRMATPILVDSVGFNDKTWRDRLKMDGAESIGYKESGQAPGTREGGLPFLLRKRNQLLIVARITIMHAGLWPTVACLMSREVALRKTDVQFIGDGEGGSIGCERIS